MTYHDPTDKRDYPSESFFKIYYIASPIVPETVSQEINADHGYDGCHLEHYWNHTVKETIQHHREIVKPGGQYHPDLIMIIDRSDISAGGILVLNLDYHGYVDAIRREKNEAGNIVGSLSILNTAWCEERSAYGEKSKFVPRDHFALYNLLPNVAITATAKDEKNSFDAAVKLMNEGIGSPDLETEEDEGSYEILAHPRVFYQPIESNDKDLDQIVASHDQLAQERQLDSSMLAVVDSNWEDEGVLIIKMTQGKEVDSFRRKGYAAGEMLSWIFIGFTTWEEAKNWDPTVASS